MSSTLTMSIRLKAMSVGNTEHVYPCVTKKTASSLTYVLQLQCTFSMATPPEQVSTV